MKVILFGATGMVGSAVLGACLKDPEITSILCIGRRASGATDPRVRDLVQPDMFDVSVRPAEITGYDACFFCLGVSSVFKSEMDYTRLTYDLTMGWAHVLANANPQLRFVYVSGLGTGGKAMWARVKGRLEEALLVLFPRAVMIRLGALRPMAGERSRTRVYRLMLAVARPLWPIFKTFAPGFVITTEELGRAMIRVAREPAGQRIFENHELITLGADLAR